VHKTSGYKKIRVQNIWHHSVNNQHQTSTDHHITVSRYNDDDNNNTKICKGKGKGKRGFV